MYTLRRARTTSGKLDRVKLLMVTNSTFDGIVHDVERLAEECLAINPPGIPLGELSPHRTRRIEESVLTDPAAGDHLSSIVRRPLHDWRPQRGSPARNNGLP